MPLRSKPDGFAGPSVVMITAGRLPGRQAVRTWEGAAITMDFLLIAGLWLDGAAWDAVVPHLRALAHEAVPVWLPGPGAPPATATLSAPHAAVPAPAESARHTELGSPPSP